MGRRIFPQPVIGLLVVLVFATALPALADDVGITSARLMELGDGGYAIEADVSPMMVAALRSPIVPERFTLGEHPVYRRVGVNLVVRYEFGGSDRPLDAGDVLLLPWARSAVLLTARWADGTVQRAMFPRSTAGIRVPIAALKPMEQSPVYVARNHLGFEIEKLVPMLVRLLIILGIVIASGGFRAVRLVLVFTGGHALSMAALDLGAPILPSELAGAGLALGAALLARSARRENEEGLWPLILTLGLVDGLGIADRLIGSGIGPGEVVSALFGAMVGLDVVLISIAAALIALAHVVFGSGACRTIAIGLGGVAMAAVIALTVSGIQTARDFSMDPADRMAAARFELKSGAAAGSGASGGRAAPPPRRLDDAAMIFLTIEPTEVRAEVLLSLADFLEPLKIEGGPTSVVPVAVQETIAARAKQMVARTIGVNIDGREAVPILERTDFVTVAATGVTTRREPEPEPLATSVLGVTLVYGVEGPPSEITLGWQVFTDASTTVPAVWTDPTGSERTTLTREAPTLEWVNDLSSYEPPPLAVVVVNPPLLPMASIVLFIMAVALFGLFKNRRWRWSAGVPLIAAVALYPFVRHAVMLPGVAGWTPSKTEATAVVDDLLTNTYRAFGLRDENAIYDRLEISVSGDKLSEIYLENRRALELEDRGGARAKVDDVEVLELRSVERDGKGGFRVEAVWTVSGSVNHFGHVHYRQNRYDAALHLWAVDGAWKITEVEILDERRVL